MSSKGDSVNGSDNSVESSVDNNTKPEIPLEIPQNEGLTKGSSLSAGGQGNSIRLPVTDIPPRRRSSFNEPNPIMRLKGQETPKRGGSTNGSLNGGSHGSLTTSKSYETGLKNETTVNNSQATSFKTQLPESNVPQKEKEPAAAGGDHKAHNSHASLGSSFTNADAKSREFVESPYEKLLEIKNLLLSIVLNILLLVVIVQLASETGMIVSFGGSVFAVATGVLIQIWMVICHVFTGIGINEASSLLFGHYLSQKTGFCLSVCGFAHSSILKKLTFTNILAYKSKSKPLLNKITRVWIFHLLLIILTIFCTTDISAKVLRVDKGKLACIIYHEDGDITDREFPDLHAALGNGEYVFGTSLGHMRSQEDVPVTTHAFPPQLIDMFVDGTTIVGGGLLTDIYTTCLCSSSFTDEDMIYAGVREETVGSVKTLLTGLGEDLGFVNDIVFTNSSAITITTVLNYRNACGGTAQDSTPYPVCTTTMFNHRNAEIVSSYMSDGSTSSVALKFIKIREEYDAGNMTWVHRSLTNLMGGELTSTVLPESVAGSVSTLLWWCTTNLQSISPPLLGTGLETAFAILLKTGMQRTMSFDETFCTQNVADDTSMVLSMTSFGLLFGCLFVGGQLLINLICLMACVPRMLEVNPVGPAIRICRDFTYFILLLNGSFTAGILSECKSSVHVDDVWLKMDLFVRVGETIGTKDDPEKGNVTIDRPKFVTNLIKGKRYT